MTLRTDYLIAGTGPSALIHYLNLKNSGKEAVLLGSGLYGQLKPVEYRQIGKSVNLLPIFPVTESNLWKRLNPDLKADNHLTLEKINLNGIRRPEYRLQACYYNYLLQHQQESDIPYILSYKQFGDLIFKHPLTELKKKLNRNYRSGQPKYLKTGFVNGLSPYYSFLKSREPYPVIPGMIEQIDYVNKMVHTKKGAIRYNHLIYTLPLDYFFDTTDLKKTFQLISGDARFLIYYTDEHLPENHLWYCCDIDSNIYRAFVPQKNLLVVQLSKKSWEKNPNEISTELQSLTGIKEKFHHIDTTTHLHCYPLDVSCNIKKEELAGFLREHNVYLSGRFAEWRYIDLHEVDYDLNQYERESYVRNTVGYE